MAVYIVQMDEVDAGKGFRLAEAVGCFQPQTEKALARKTIRDTLLGGRAWHLACVAEIICWWPPDPEFGSVPASPQAVSKQTHDGLGTAGVIRGVEKRNS